MLTKDSNPALEQLTKLELYQLMERIEQREQAEREALMRKMGGNA